MFSTAAAAAAAVAVADNYVLCRDNNFAISAETQWTAYVQRRECN